MKTYCIWSNKKGSVFTLVEGTDKLKFVDGTIDPDCYEVVHSFEAFDMEDANHKYDEYMEKK